MRTLLVLCAALLASGALQAQARYQCRMPNGSAYFSDRPCATSTSTPQQFGVIETRPSYTPRPPSIGEAPAHLNYMSARCASLNDALRTGPARGLTSDTLNTMRRDYQRECGEDESEARQQFARERQEARSQQSAQRMAQNQERDRARLHEQQCGESKRILITKRARTDLTDGEKAELRRFEQNYQARCN